MIAGCRCCSEWRSEQPGSLPALSALAGGGQAPGELDGERCRSAGLVLINCCSLPFSSSCPSSRSPCSCRSTRYSGLLVNPACAALTTVLFRVVAVTLTLTACAGERGSERSSAVTHASVLHSIVPPCAWGVLVTPCSRPPGMQFPGSGQRWGSGRASRAPSRLWQPLRQGGAEGRAGGQAWPLRWPRQGPAVPSLQGLPGISGGTSCPAVPGLRRSRSGRGDLGWHC